MYLTNDILVILLLTKKYESKISFLLIVYFTVYLSVLSTVIGNCWSFELK